jgi:ABC-type glutathione transport system ATPase component
MYGLLGLYFDQILSGPNGEPRKWYFPFEPLINRLRRPVCIHLEYDNDIDYEEPHETSISTGNRNNLDVQEEEHIVRRLLTRSGEENQMNLQIAGLSKIFSKGCIKPLNHKAVNKVWLGAQEGEILAVLG